MAGKYGIAALDSTKVTINLKEWGVSGVTVGEALRKEKIAVELVDLQNVLFLVTYADWAPVQWQDTVNRICKTLQKLRPVKNPLEARSVEQVKALETEAAEREKAQQAEIPVTESAVPMRTVFYGKKKTVPLSPVILPGERFTDKIVAWCCLMKQQGLPVSGPADTSLQTVRVLTQE